MYMACRSVHAVSHQFAAGPSYASTSTPWRCTASDVFNDVSFICEVKQDAMKCIFEAPQNSSGVIN